MADGAAALAAVDTSVSVDTAAVDTQTVDTQTQDTQTADVQTDQQDTQQQADGQQDTQQEATVDLAAVPQLVKGAIEKLKATDPAMARALRDYFHQQSAFNQEFPGGIKEARELKQTIESLGGSEGIQGLQAEKQEWQTIDEKFANGDASVLDTFAQHNPEGFSKIIPAALDKLVEVDKAAYDHALARPFVATLDSWRFGDTLNWLASTLSQVVGEDGKPLLGQQVQVLQGLGQNIDGLRKLAEKVPEKSIDPERQKLEDEKKAFAEQKQTALRAEVGAETQKYAESKYEGLIQAESKAGVGLPEKGTRSYTTMMKEIDGEIARELGKDKLVLQKMNALDATGKKAELVAYMNAQFDRVAPKVVQRVCKEWMTTKNPQPVKRAANNPQGVNGSGKLAEAPTQDQIDWSKTSRADVMNRRAFLKGRNQQVTW